MSLKYEIAFMAEVLNDYFTDLACEDVSLIPTAETAQLLRGHNMRTKTVGNKLVVLVNVDDGGKPFVQPDPTARFRFYITVENAAFCNYSNIDYRPAVLSKYYFTNLNQTKVGTVLNISSSISQYNNANAYVPGSLAADGSGNVFEAIKSNKSGNAHALNETAYWIPRGKVQYVNGNDIMQLTGDSYRFRAAAAKDFVINIYGLDTTTNLYDNLVNTSSQHFDAPQTSVLIDLSILPYGKYRLEVNGASKVLYYDSVAVSINVFGIVDIFNNLDGANDFALFDAGGLPKKRTFTIRFANRYAIWKYIARTNDVTAIKDNAAVYTFSNIPASTAFASSVPIPFSEQPLDTLFLESASLGHITPIPNPGSDRLTMIQQGGDSFFCAEKRLNY